jgi:F-type H+-transporting ATPase subunit epsilon
MSGLGLTISTPLQIVVQVTDVASIRTADDSGSFGILPGHVGLLTVIRASVLQWRGVGGPWSFCALRGGVLTVYGTQVRVTCRQAVIGTDLSALAIQVETRMTADLEAARQARVERARMHAQAIRQIMRHMRAEGSPAEDPALERLFE